MPMVTHGALLLRLHASPCRCASIDLGKPSRVHLLSFLCVDIDPLTAVCRHDMHIIAQYVRRKAGVSPSFQVPFRVKEDVIQTLVHNSLLLFCILSHTICFIKSVSTGCQT